MKLVRLDDVGEFIARSERFLVAEEARENLILGVAARLRDGAFASEEPPYLGIVEDRAAGVVAAVLRTPGRAALLSRMGDARVEEVIAAGLYTAVPDLPGFQATGDDGAALAAAWERLTGQRGAVEMRQGVYMLEEVEPPPLLVPGQMRRAGVADHSLVVDWLREFEAEAFSESARELSPGAQSMIIQRLRRPSPSAGFRLWEDDTTVSIAGYGGRTPNGVRIGPVWTPPALRRHGYATALVAALSAEMLASGAHWCFLYTDLANRTSNAIYQRIGYRWVCQATHYRFAGPRRDQA